MTRAVLALALVAGVSGTAAYVWLYEANPWYYSDHVGILIGAGQRQHHVCMYIGDEVQDTVLENFTCEVSIPPWCLCYQRAKP